MVKVNYHLYHSLKHLSLQATVDISTWMILQVCTSPPHHHLIDSTDTLFLFCLCWLKQDNFFLLLCLSHSLFDVKESQEWLGSLSSGTFGELIMRSAEDHQFVPQTSCCPSCFV